MIENGKSISEKCCLPYLDTQERKCRVCGEKDIKEYLEVYDGDMYGQCSTCGSIVLLNLPKTEELYNGDQL